MFFDGFTLCTAALDAGPIRYRVGGAGPALLLIHGNPQTHAMWHAVAPVLARRFTVVCPDLRGYGGSMKPAGDAATYSKAAMADDLAALMTALGHDRFAIAGHDRGAWVGQVLAVDHAARVERLAVLDCVPSGSPVDRQDMAFDLGEHYGCWFAQPHPFAEDLIGKGPNTWFTGHTGMAGIPAFFAPEALADYLAAADDPAAVDAMTADYHACVTVDAVHDRMRLADGKRVACDVLVLWGALGKIGGWYDPVALWREVCDGPVSGTALPCGHFLAEEAPERVAGALEAFFAATC